MPLPATVAHLDVDAVADVLINHHANIRNAARALNVPSGDLRKWVLLDERLSAAAVEAIELKLDVAEANLHEALGSEDPRRRDVVSMFFLRHTQRAAKRGYAVPALGVEANAEPARAVRYTIRWANEPVDDRAEPDDSDDTVVRDGKRLIIPKYGAREGDSIDGSVVEPSVLIEHAVDTGVVESPVAVEPPVVEPEREPVRRGPLRARAHRRLDSRPAYRLSAGLLPALPQANRRGGGVAGSFERRGESALSSDLPRRMAY